MNDPIQIAQFLNDKYASVCSDKCKLINALETIGRECRTTQKEIMYLLDLLGECLTDKDLLSITNSDDEFVEDGVLDASVDLDLVRSQAGKLKQLASGMNSGERAKSKTKQKSKTKAQKPATQQ